jgi:hypothetical protein
MALFFKYKRGSRIASEILIIGPVPATIAEILWMWGGAVVAMERLLSLRFARFSDAGGAARVVEPELDMRREVGRRRSAIAGLLHEAIGWLMPATRSIAPPMRSVDRELWETSNDR